MERTVPVCIFNGFLESGKTTLIQSLLEDRSVNNGKGILLLLCEEGEVELEPERFCSPNVYIETIEDDTEFTREHLQELQRETDCNMVMIEKHGLWPEFFVRSKLPDNWTVVKEYMTIDFGQIITQNNNFRELIGDSIRCSNFIIVNRAVPDKDLQIRIHKIIRALNRKCQILFQSVEGAYYQDNMVLPPPFDMGSEEINIEDSNYAFFQQDIMELPNNYAGKTVTLKGRAFKQDTYDIPGLFYFGRFVHFSSMKDIRFMPIPAVYSKADELTERDWYLIKAHITLEEIIPGTEFPVLQIDSISLTNDNKPKPEVAFVYDGKD